MQRRSSRRRKPSAEALEAQENNAKALAAMPATSPQKRKKTTAPKKKLNGLTKYGYKWRRWYNDTWDFRKGLEKDKSDQLKIYISLEKYVNNENWIFWNDWSYG